MKIGDFELSLKQILIIVIALIVIIGIFSWVFSSNDVSVYGVNFHIPNGYNEIEQQPLTKGVGESFSYSNKEYHEDIYITVKDTNASDISQIKFNYPSVKTNAVIGGKEGILAMTGTGVRNHFLYIENGKLIHIDVPFTDPQNNLHDEDVIAEIIK
ncbi:hypothetical protein [Methanobrevibacter sp.]|uniref:hypothetical protein n=1 Tax=Methanobrevibacter sp. TaxID=66852 RepID=UPI00388E0B47